MRWFLNISTRAKLFFGFGSMIVLLVAVAATAYQGITEIVVTQKKLYEEGFDVALRMQEVRANQNGIREGMLMIILSQDEARLHKRITDVTSRAEAIQEAMPAIRRGLRNEPRLLAMLAEFHAILNAFEEVRTKEMVPLLLAGKNEEAKKLALGLQAERNRQMRTLANQLVNESVKRAQEQLQESERRAGFLVSVFLGAGIAALLIGIALALFLTRIIAIPLNRISGVAEQVAGGDLTVAMPPEKREDEVGALAETFRVMLERLGGMLREIGEGVAVLASSASEIMASTAQVASGAAETASAVSETSSTVEEVKQTAQVTSQKALSVSEAAQDAVQMARGGRKAVEESVAGMGRIQEQVAAIAESIVKLSEQGQAIGEIIAAVNDLAEQSNLLAVNAAIEAAKAGEQGKGFAVVAQEVRSLAEQSKEATAQVRTILNDIQKATNAAVLATEQGNKAVEAGVKQSREAGEAIRQMGESIEASAQAALQIAASSRQQLTGMDQVALAMENIRQASEQNVAGSKQVEATVQNLHELGQKLNQLMEQYKV